MLKKTVYLPISKLMKVHSPNSEIEVWKQVNSENLFIELKMAYLLLLSNLLTASLLEQTLLRFHDSMPEMHIYALFQI